MHDAQKPETTATTDFQRPNVIFQLKTRKGVQAGINLIVDAIRPTLGSLPRTVALTRLQLCQAFPRNKTPLLRHYSTSTPHPQAPAVLCEKLARTLIRQTA